MVFSSPIFLFYFLPLICVVYLLTPARAKNAVLLLGSLGFYAWGAGHFAAVLIASIAVNYALGLAIHWAAQGEREGILRCAVAGTVAVNLSLLAYYKYANFVAGELAVEGWVQIALPIGISFFTFQSMSYAFDVARGRAAVLRNPIVTPWLDGCRSLRAEDDVGIVLSRSLRSLTEFRDDPIGEIRALASRLTAVEPDGQSHVPGLSRLVDASRDTTRHIGSLVERDARVRQIGVDRRRDGTSHARGQRENRSHEPPHHPSLYRVDRGAPPRPHGGQGDVAFHRKLDHSLPVPFVLADPCLQEGGPFHQIGRNCAGGGDA